MEDQNEYYNNHNSYISPAFGTPNGSTPVSQYPGNEYKLYVRPIGVHYDEATLAELFSQCGKVTEVYISPITEPTGFRWAFIYYDCQAAADEAIEKFDDFEKYGFKIKYAAKNDATKKKFTKPFPLNETIHSRTSEVGTKMELNGVSFVSPPNCKFCKKLTFFTCGSCQNSFCNTECSIDGWRFHTSECIKVANLVHTDDTKKGQNGATLSDTVVNFMKNISITKKNFSTDEFAAAVKPAQIMPEKPVQVLPEYKPERFAPIFDYDRRNNNSFACRKPVARKFTNDDNNASTFGKKFNDDAPSFGKKLNNDVSSFDKRFRNDAQPFTKKCNNFSNENDAPSLIPTRSYNQPNSENEEENGYRRDSTDDHVSFRPKKSTDSHISFKPKKSTDASNSFDGKRRSNDSDNEKKPARNFQPRDRPPVRDRPNPRRENKPAPVPSTPSHQPTDLILQVGKTIETIVTSIVDEKTFFIADPEKCAKFMKKFNEEAVALPTLECPRVDLYCFSSFEDGWYRAKILSLEPLKVLYVDFGNEAEVQRSELKLLPVKYKKMLPLATKVRLSSGTVTEHEICEFEQPIIHPKELDESGVWIVDVI